RPRAHEEREAARRITAARGTRSVEQRRGDPYRTGGAETEAISACNQRIAAATRARRLGARVAGSEVRTTEMNFLTRTRCATVSLCKRSRPKARSPARVA